MGRAIGALSSHLLVEIEVRRRTFTDLPMYVHSRFSLHIRAMRSSSPFFSPDSELVMGNGRGPTIHLIS